MKIRSFIFLTVIALGLLPMLVLIALSFPKTLERLEYAAELETQARSHVGFTQLNARVRCLKKSLIRSATLPFTVDAVHDSAAMETFVGVVDRWFGKDEQVKGIMYIDAEGNEHLSLHRHNKGLLQQAGDSENHKDHIFFNHSLAVAEGQVLVQLVDQQSDPFHRAGKEEYELIMSTPVVSPLGKTAGVLLMRIDMSRFLKSFMDSFWVTENGEYLRGECLSVEKSSEFPMNMAQEDASGCNAFGEFPALEISKTNDPMILTGDKDVKIAWMPLVFNREQHTVMWVGTVVDESAMKKWKMTLSINVVVLILIMSGLFFLCAKWLATKLDFIQKDLLSGLDNIINKEKRVEFHWTGPLELQNLSRDLTALSERYSATCEARNRAEASLSESEDKFRSLTSQALDGIILMDHEGYITYWNEAAFKIFGYTVEEALQHPIHSLISPRREGADLLVHAMEKVGTGENLARSVELIARNRNGNDVPVELSLSSTTIQGQWHAIWIVRDISERRRTEEESRNQQQQLLHADKMISLGLLVSGVAHEINNPNSIALLNIPVLSRAWESVKPILDEFYEEHGDFAIAGLEYSTMRNQLPRICRELEESAIRIKQIVVDLKDYARQETSGLMEPVDLNEIVQSGVRLTANSIHKSSNTFSCSYASQPLMVMANRQRLTQVVINLIQNSCEALEDPSRSLKVSTGYDKEKDGVEISIHDEGTGIAPENLKQVTDPFFTTKRSIGGTGLGLSVSSGIVKEHSGAMEFYSERGVGTKVIVVFPAYHEDV